MKLNGAQILCEGLVREGVEVIFGFPGGRVIQFFDTFEQYPQLRFVLVRHEQAAAHAADAYARVTGRVGCCVATSGPGATNLVTGIATAHLDSAPMVAITGQVDRPSLGRDAFQEIDITGITLPITKHNYLVMKSDEMAEAVKEAFHIAGTGRPGPVLIDVPSDVWVEQAEFKYPDKVELPGYKPEIKIHPSQVKKAAKAISEAKRPIIIAGNGVIISDAYAELKELAEKAQIPVTNTLLGIGCFPQGHVLYYGMVGMHGMAYANYALNESDLIIAIGMRFDDRVTSKLSTFATRANVIHIDIDAAEIDKNIKANVPVVGDIKEVLTGLNKDIEKQSHGEWIKQIDAYRSEHPSHEIRETDCLLPQYVVRCISEVSGGDAVVVTGVGQHQMWAAQHSLINKPKSFISSGGLGTMGYSLPAAIGAQMGRPNETVWSIDGDGSFQMTLQELATIQQERLPIKIAILNNGYLGMVRQWQEFFWDKRYVATPITGPDFVKIAEAYGVPGMVVTDRKEVIPAIRKATNHDGPYLLDFRVEPEENVYPMVKPGAAICELLEQPKSEVKTW
ncbi:biosynthetic-type acetolactate synthase large subunit [Chloroflexota bacterium]